MRCRVCDHPGLTPLWPDAGGNQWARCTACGSDTSTARYTPGMYSDAYLSDQLSATGGMDAAREQVRSLIEWFGHHAAECPNRSFLDVGCLEGGALDVAQAHGWSVHGWDCIPAAARPGCTTITPYFAAGFFPQQYSAVMCKDVLEHAPGVRAFLSELAAVTATGGLLLIQTPRPDTFPHPAGYQPAHLFVINPPALEAAVTALGFRVLDRRQWEGTETGPAGFALLARKVDGL